MKIRFEWDQSKADRNIKKHHVRFEIAVRVFTDPFALMAQDRIENGEHRWQTIGCVEGFLVLLVAHTIREDMDGHDVIRIISARRADAKERQRYEQARAL